MPNVHLLRSWSVVLKFVGFRNACFLVAHLSCCCIGQTTKDAVRHWKSTRSPMRRSPPHFSKHEDAKKPLFRVCLIVSIWFYMRAGVAWDTYSHLYDHACICFLLPSTSVHGTVVNLQAPCSISLLAEKRSSTNWRRTMV